MYRVYPDRVFTDGNVSINAGGRMSLVEINHTFVNNRIAGDERNIPIAVIIRVDREFFERGFPLRKFLHTNNIVTAIVNIVHDLSIMTYNIQMLGIGEKDAPGTVCGFNP